MKLLKFINKKTILFVILIIAFIYFSGLFNISEGFSRSGSQHARARSAPKHRSDKIIKSRDCSGCKTKACHPKCPKINYKEFKKCVYNGKNTVCSY